MSNFIVNPYSFGSSSIYPNGLGSSADGTNTSITLNESDQKLGTGCYEFNGSSSRVNITATIPTANNYSISSWVYMDSGIATGDATWRMLFNGSWGLTIYYSATPDTLKVEFANAGSGAITPDAISGEEWHLLTVVNDSGTFTYYVDGSSAGTATTASASSGSDFSIGADGTGNLWSGLIDDTCIWQTSLSSANVTALWNSGDGVLANTVNPGDITCYYNFDSDTDDKLINQAIP